MIKKSFFFLLFVICCLLFIVSPINAQKKEASSSSTKGADEVIEKLKQIELLKEKIATKVAQIREKEKEATAGLVKKTTPTSLLITTLKNEEITISYSDDTLFYTLVGGEKKEITVKSIKENDFISVFGYKEKETSTLQSKYIYIQIPSVHIVGKIADIDKTNFTITVKEKEGNKVIDIESSTKMTLITWDRKKQKGGFSKFKIGDSIHVVGKRDKKDTEKISASFITTLPNPNQEISSPISTPSATPKK